MIPIQPSLQAEAIRGQIPSAALLDHILRTLDAMGMWLGSGVCLSVESLDGQSANNWSKVVASPVELRDILTEELFATGATKLRFNRVAGGSSAMEVIRAMGSGELEVVPDGHGLFKLSLTCHRSTYDSCHDFIDGLERVLGSFDKRHVRFIGNYST